MFMIVRKIERLTPEERKQVSREQKIRRYDSKSERRERKEPGGSSSVKRNSEKDPRKKATQPKRR